MLYKFKYFEKLQKLQTGYINMVVNDTVTMDLQFEKNF